jgi:hypothetical protein
MVGHGRYENSQDHRNRTTVARREDEREELRLVADLRENDDSGRNEKCFQDFLRGRPFADKRKSATHQ